MTPKYFHYISKAKVDMLLAQVRRRPLGLLSFSPKIEFAGISLGADLKSEANKGLVTDTLRLLKTLKRQRAITAVDAERKLDSRNFYHSEDMWRHGCFYFATLPSFTVTYLLWRTYNQSVVLLAGSPENIIGQINIRDGVHIASTGEAMETLGSEDFLRAIEQDEPTRSTAYEPDFDDGILSENIDWLHMTHVKSNAAPMAMFCFRHLTRLTEMRVETVFKVFSTLESVTGNFLSDLNLEYEGIRSQLDEDDSKKPKWQQGAEHRKFVEEYWKARISKAKMLGLQNYKTVHIGSPVYTALA